MTSKRTKAQRRFPRLSLLSMSAGELLRFHTNVEVIQTAAGDLVNITGELRQAVELLVAQAQLLQAAVAGGAGRRRGRPAVSSENPAAGGNSAGG